MEDFREKFVQWVTEQDATNPEVMAVAEKVMKGLGFPVESQYPGAEIEFGTFLVQFYNSGKDFYNVRFADKTSINTSMKEKMASRKFNTLNDVLGEIEKIAKANNIPMIRQAPAMMRPRGTVFIVYSMAERELDIMIQKG